MDERWREMWRIFHEAAPLAPAERAVFLRDACRDDASLGAEVESLLIHDGNPEALRTQSGRRMNLIGQRIGVYEIRSLLGVGGMGEVYRAHDVKLGRDVALKVLPAEVASDAERLSRFQREARILASLNHPHIGAIHGFEEGSDMPALVLELIEGDTLAERIAKGPISLPTALNIARQIAEALEAAHEHGVIHRDLKPANIKITPDGVVKVLDFGLAKPFGDGSARDLSQSPTLTIRGTKEGIILGTAPYMSPEQARGDRVDARTDIWAFGCVLYEMLTGDAPFRSASVQDTLAAVLRTDPDWTRLPAVTPAGLRKLLMRCLEKDPRRRLKAIGDARLEIEDLPEDEVAQTSEHAARISSWKSGALWAIAAAVFVVGGFGMSLLIREREQVQPRATTARLDLALPAGAPMAPGGSLALSLDGKRLVYVAQVGGERELHLRDMSTGTSRAIPGTKGARSAFFSPDGERVGFFAEGRLKKVAVAGGEPVVLAEAPLPFGGTWSSDDTIYFNAHEGGGLFRISAGGGQVQAVTRGQDVWPDILPDGNTVLFTRYGFGAGFGVYALRNGESRKLLSFASYARYAPTGHLVYGEVGKLLAVPFDAAALEVTGPPVTLFEDIRTAARGFGVASFAISSAGMLVYAPGQDSRIASLVWVSREGKIEPLGMEPGSFGPLSLSPDGKQLAIPIFEGAGSDIWIYHVDRGTRTRFTFGLRNDPRSVANAPRWTPDGKHIVYTSSDLASPDMASLDGERAKLNFYWKPVDGSREAVQLLTTDDLRKITGDESRLGEPGSFSPDGSVMTFFSLSPATGFDVWLLRLGPTDPAVTKPPKPEPFLRTRFGEAFGQFSPDGRWIAYMSNESGEYEVYVRPYPGPGPAVPISTDGGLEAIWHPNRRELFYRLGTRYLAVDLTLTPEFKAGKPRVLFDGPFIDMPGYDSNLSKGDDRFLRLHNPELSQRAQTLTVITNFFDELHRRVPATRPF